MQRVIGTVVLAGILLVCSCQPVVENSCNFKDAQMLIDKTVAAHPEIVRLTIHAVPSGQTQNIIVACNIREKLGKVSDPEDLETMETKKLVVLKEGNNLDVTAPILDKSGNVIAAAGITLRGLDSTNEQALTEKAKAIAAELSQAVQNSLKPLW